MRKLSWLAVFTAVGSLSGISVPGSAQTLLCPETGRPLSEPGCPFHDNRPDESNRPVRPQERDVDPAEWGNAISNAMQQYMADLSAYHELKGKLESDPRYHRYMNGEWRFFQAGKTPKPGENCTALWSRQGSLLTLTGWGPAEPDEVLLTFWGKDIPRPAKAGYVTVTIKQTGARAQKVKAVNYAPPGMDVGALALEAKWEDSDDAFNGELSVNGKTVVRENWRDGAMAYRKLRACWAKGAAK